MPEPRELEGPPRSSCGDCGCRIFLTGRALQDGLCRLCREEATWATSSSTVPGPRPEQRPAQVPTERHAAVKRCRPARSAPATALRNWPWPARPMRTRPDERDCAEGTAHRSTPVTVNARRASLSPLKGDKLRFRLARCQPGAFTCRLWIFRSTPRTAFRRNVLSCSGNCAPGFRVQTIASAPFQATAIPPSTRRSLTPCTGSSSRPATLLRRGTPRTAQSTRTAPSIRNRPRDGDSASSATATAGQATPGHDRARPPPQTSTTSHHPPTHTRRSSRRCGRSTRSSSNCTTAPRTRSSPTQPILCTGRSSSPANSLAPGQPPAAPDTPEPHSTQRHRVVLAACSVLPTTLGRHVRYRLPRSATGNDDCRSDANRPCPATSTTKSDKMPSPYEHLTTAESLLQEARTLLEEGRYRAADSHTRLASRLIEAAHAREKILPAPPSIPETRREPLLDWCGLCDGPDLALRWMPVTLPGEDTTRMARCPNCHPAVAARTNNTPHSDSEALTTALPSHRKTMTSTTSPPAP